MLYLTIWLCFGLLAALIYKNKGRDLLGGFLLGVLLGPIGVLLAALSNPDPKIIEARRLATGTQKKCPRCAELVQADALVCKHCSHEFTPAVPLPENAARKVTDGGGWRCSACNGGVRSEATECKHCRRVFIA